MYNLLALKNTQRRVHMYIIKNALRCISRAKGRNILIGIIVLVIAVSSCIGLSIRQAADDAKQTALDNLSITAIISFDRQSMMKEMRGEKPEESSGERPKFDRDNFKEVMNKSSSLTLEEYQTYAKIDSVKDFYYTITANFNETEKFEAVTTETSTQNSQIQNMPNNKGGMMGDFRNSGDFKVRGYSGENAMTNFVNGVASITDGALFDEGTSEMNCIISEELATYNSLSVGDTVVISNTNSETETYTLTVVGIYSDTSANESSFGNPMMSTDPANNIYMSYNAVQSIVDKSKSVATVTTDENTGRESSTATTGTLNATYVFADIDGYEAFETEVYKLGLDESYTVSSQDLTMYENSMTPLNTLSTMAGWFLIVILLIGAVILIVLNIFNVRERKYEIGVLTAMGMKKGKVALQFLTEIFAVTITAVIIGIVIGAVSSVPVTNALLENQANAQTSQSEQISMNFGRGSQMGNEMPDFPQENMKKPDNFGGMAVNYITEINSAMNLTVVFQMLIIAAGLTLISGTVSMLFVMRYGPLKILSNRD